MREDKANMKVKKKKSDKRKRKRVETKIPRKR